MAMEMAPLGPKCGVEISGVALASCSDAEMDAISKGFDPEV